MEMCVTVQNIYNGQSGFQNEMENDYIWEGIVVFKNGNYTNTVSAPIP